MQEEDESVMMGVIKWMCDENNRGKKGKMGQGGLFMLREEAVTIDKNAHLHEWSSEYHSHVEENGKTCYFGRSKKKKRSR